MVMTKIVWRSLLLSPIVLAATLIGSNTAIAANAPTEPDSQPTGATTLSLTTQLTQTQATPLKPAASPVQMAGLPEGSFADRDLPETGATASSLLDSPSNMSQVTSVSQLSDVQPTDWAFQALQSLVERYGCIAGYPDGTFKGNRALTRYEFAAGLNACLDRVNELIAAGTTGLATKEDLETLRKLQEEFAAELATLRGRVDALEARTTELEKNQFSTTTKLDGEVVFAAVGAVAGDDADGSRVDRSTALGHRTRLNFETSFTGRDSLRTRLQADNLGDPTDLLLEGDLFYYGESNSDIVVDALLYTFPIGENTEISLIANAGASDDFSSTVNFLDGDGGSGALSTFGTRAPIYYLISGAGAGIRHEFGDLLELSFGYLTEDASDPSTSRGLFNGSYGALAQLLIKPTSKLNIGLTYINSYNTETGTGSLLSNPRTFLDIASGQEILPGTTLGDILTGFGFSTDIPIINNAYGIQVSWQAADWLVLGGWAGYVNTRNLSSGNGLFERGSLDSFNWAVTLAFPDLLTKGSVGGIIFGMEPKVIDGDINVNAQALAALGQVVGAAVPGLGEDDDTSFHIEAFYQFRLSDNIAITPGIVWITAPDHNSNNDDLVIGTIRTTFTF
jgi:hypothetical protein